MPLPVVHAFPVRRPNYIKTAEWVGPDQQLQFKITFDDENGVQHAINFNTRNLPDGVKGEVCLPTGLLGNDLRNLGSRYEDVLIAHTRMSCLVARSGIPGSDEFMDALLNGPTANIQTALGVVKVTAVEPVDDQTVKITFKCGTGPELPVNMDYADLNNYVFAPVTQLFVVAGAIKKQFNNYVHDYPNTILSQDRRDEIAAYVLTLEPWI